MRKLMWFVIGFAAACGLCAYGAYHRWILPGGFLSVLLAVAAAGLIKRKELIPPMIAVLLGCIAGLGWFGAYRMVYLGPVTALEGETMQLCLTAQDYGYETGYGTSADSRVTIAGHRYQVRMYLTEEVEISPGDRITGIFRIELTMPEDYRDSAYLQGKGAFLLAYQTGEVTVEPVQHIPKWCYPAMIRRHIRTLQESLFPEDVYPFAVALMLGDSKELSYEVDTALKVSGIRHIVAVSGLHISILYGMISLVTLRKRYLTALLGIPMLFLFAGVAGFTPSVNRACIMIGLMLMARVFDREYDAPTALAFSVLMMLAANPLAVTSVSLQMSVLCVAGILLFNAPISRWMKEKMPNKKGISGKMRNLFCSSLAVTLSAMSLVTPLSACYFGAVSLVSPLSNLLTLWAVHLVFQGLVFCCLLHPLVPYAAALLAKVLVWPVRYVLTVSDWIAHFPLAAVYTKSVYVVCWLIFVYVLLAVFLGMKKKQPAVLLWCGVLGLCAALTASWMEPLSQDTRITMLDVGQGQAIVLQTKGKTFLVDCGGSDDERTADIVAETLLSQGIQRLDSIVITHYDQDHAGGLCHLLTRVDADRIFLPDTQNEMEQLPTSGQILYVWEDMQLRAGDAVLQIYGPVYSGFSNENSLCVLFDAEKYDILITGDRSSFGERMLLRHRQLPDVDILVAGHHGAADSTSVELLKAVKPETVLISVAEHNIYEHPSPVLLNRLAEYGCSVFRTDIHGTITIGR